MDLVAMPVSNICDSFGFRSFQGEIMKIFLVSWLFVLGLLGSTPGFGYGIHCKYTPGEFWLDFSGGMVLLRAKATNTFDLKELELHPGHSYWYNEILLGFHMDGCVQSNSNLMQIHCLAPATKLKVSSPETENIDRKLVVGSIGIEPFKKKGTDYVGYNVTLTFQGLRPDGYLGATAQNTIFFESGCSVNGKQALR